MENKKKLNLVGILTSIFYILIFVISLAVMYGYRKELYGYLTYFIRWVINS